MQREGAVQPHGRPNQSQAARLLRGDLERIPLLLARVYDSGLSAEDDFGKGSHLSAAETIKREVGGGLHLFSRGRSGRDEFRRCTYRAFWH